MIIMRKESFDEIFTYIGHRELTPEEEAERQESRKRAMADFELCEKLIALGLPY